jgi:hypothetical protein
MYAQHARHCNFTVMGRADTGAEGQGASWCSQVEIFCYALSPSDNSEWRLRIEREAEHFLDVSSWSVPDIAGKMSADGIHIAVNLNGYTKACCNVTIMADVFAPQGFIIW